MNIIKKPSWQISENEVTPQELFEKRIIFLKLGAASMITGSPIVEALAKDKNPNNLKLNTYDEISSYNNFYEFTTSKENPKEYGFFANVNPNVDHPRWSQA